jgi:hypothetical protein
MAGGEGGVEVKVTAYGAKFWYLYGVLHRDGSRIRGWRNTVVPELESLIDKWKITNSTKQQTNAS